MSETVQITTPVPLVDLKVGDEVTIYGRRHRVTGVSPIEPDGVFERFTVTVMDAVIQDYMAALPWYDFTKQETP